MFLGDSKSVYPNNAWPSLLLAVWFGGHSYGAVGGQTVATAVAAMDATLATFPADGGAVNYQIALLNWGANDVVDLPAEAAWEADYLSIIDKVHAKAPNTKLYLTLPWRRGFNANCDTLATRIGHVVAARPGVAFAGDDERVWMKGADDGAAMTTDGIHPSAAGQIEKVAQVRSVVGR